MTGRQYIASLMPLALAQVYLHPRDVPGDGRFLSHLCLLWFYEGSLLLVFELLAPTEPGTNGLDRVWRWSFWGIFIPPMGLIVCQSHAVGTALLSSSALVVSYWPTLLVRAALTPDRSEPPERRRRLAFTTLGAAQLIVLCLVFPEYSSLGHVEWGFYNLQVNLVMAALLAVCYLVSLSFWKQAGTGRLNHLWRATAMGLGLGVLGLVWIDPYCGGCVRYSNVYVTVFTFCPSILLLGLLHTCLRTPTRSL